MVREIACGLWLAWTGFVVLGLALYGVAKIWEPTSFVVEFVANQLRHPLKQKGVGFTVWFCLAWLAIVLIG